MQVGVLGGAFLVAGAVLVGAGLISYAKERPVVIELLSHRAPGDAVAVVGIAVFPYTRYYHTDWTEVADSAQVDALRAHASRAHRS